MPVDFFNVNIIIYDFSSSGNFSPNTYKNKSQNHPSYHIMLRMVRFPTVRHMSTPTFGHFKLPVVQNEPMYSYEPGSTHRTHLKAALAELRSEISKGPISVPTVVGRQQFLTGDKKTQVAPTDHTLALCTFNHATPDVIQIAIKNSLAVKPMWEKMPFNDR